mmetsp:Transcript_40532/g.88583  ORF Transcript_40532/g.88583 Transcript_40532/m.88583 type:complete len:122 (+) Transcript_40532:2-367(+)
MIIDHSFRRLSTSLAIEYHLQVASASEVGALEVAVAADSSSFTQAFTSTLASSASVTVSSIVVGDFGTSTSTATTTTTSATTTTITNVTNPPASSGMPSMHDTKALPAVLMFAVVLALLAT